MAAMVSKSAKQIRSLNTADQVQRAAEPLNEKLSCVRGVSLHEVSMVPGGNDEGQAQDTVEEVTEGQMENEEGGAAPHAPELLLISRMFT